jgi:hypothetical protein
VIRAFRDGYNRTNLSVAFWSWGIGFWAVDEPWDGPRVGFLLRIGRRAVRFEVSW